MEEYSRTISPDNIPTVVWENGAKPRYICQVTRSPSRDSNLRPPKYRTDGRVFPHTRPACCGLKLSLYNSKSACAGVEVHLHAFLHTSTDGCEVKQYVTARSRNKVVESRRQSLYLLYCPDLLLRYIINYNSIFNNFVTTKLWFQAKNQVTTAQYSSRVFTALRTNWLKLLTCIREVSVSNLGHDTEYPHWVFFSHDFLPSLQQNFCLKLRNVRYVPRLSNSVLTLIQSFTL